MKRENLYTPSSIRTVSGIYVDFTNIKPSMFKIEDIAHALAKEQRFGNHLKRYYSVAQHSYYVQTDCSPVNKLAGLLHDASEAYLKDIPKPIKDLLPGYKKLEKKVMECIALKFGFKYPLPKEVHEIDKKYLEWEWENLMLKKYPVHGWGFETSKSMFISSFLSLNK